MNAPRWSVALAVAAGAALYASHPPISAWPASFLVVPLLLAAVAIGARDRPRRAAAVLGIVAGLVGFAPMLRWLILPAGLLGWGLLAAVQALWIGAFAVVVQPWTRRWQITIVAPLAWLAIEAWRGAIPLGGFGWGELAYAHVDGSWLLPLARLGGGRAVTLVVALLGALLYEVIRRTVAGAGRAEEPVADRLRTGARAAQPALLALSGVLLLSVLATTEPPPTTGETVDVLAVQGNDLVDWIHGGADDEDLAIAERMLEQTRRAVQQGGTPELTIWPESSVDRDPYTARGADLRSILDAAAELVAGDMLIGAQLQGPRAGTFKNSAVLVNADGEPVETYVKRHLVPFGEYVPARSVLGGLPPLQQVPRDGIPGEGPQQITAADVRMAVAICFETLFPRLVRSNIRGTDVAAGMLVATTNDASFGRSAEPAQHLAQSRLRAVETGRWVVHTALSGASAFVDPDGGVHDRTELFTQTWIRRSVPLAGQPTLFLRVGDVVGVAGQVGGIVLAGLALLRWRRQADRDEEEA